MTSRRPEEPAAAMAQAQAPSLDRTMTRLVFVAAATLLLVLFLDRVIWEIAAPLSLVFAGIVIAQGLAPIVAWLSRFLPRALAVVTLYLTILIAAAASAWLLLPALSTQAQEFAERIPAVERIVADLFDAWSPVSVDEAVDAAFDYLEQLSEPLLRLPMTIGVALTNLVLVFFLSLYWLIAQPQLREWVLSLMPGPRREAARGLLEDVGATIGGYVRGVLIDAILVGVFTYIGLLVIGLPSALFLAIIAGFAELIPVLGPFVAAVPAIGVALAFEENVLVVILFYIALQQVESNIVLPLVMRGQARIPPLLSLVAFLIGAAVGGIVGALIAIPLFGALRVLVVHMVNPTRRRLAGSDPADTASEPAEEEGAPVAI